MTTGVEPDCETAAIRAPWPGMAVPGHGVPSRAQGDHQHPRTNQRDNCEERSDEAIQEDWVPRGPWIASLRSQ